MKLPNLKTSNDRLFDIYTNKICLTAKELQQEFDIGDTTAYKVIRMSKEHMSEEQAMYARKTVPVDVLFSMYGWDIKSIAKKVKLRESV